MAKKVNTTRAQVFISRAYKHDVYKKEKYLDHEVVF